MRPNLRKHLLRATTGLLLAALAACSSDSPTAPRQNPPPGGGGGVQPPTTWRISVTAQPDQLAVGSDQSATITIQVTRADNGQAPPDGTTVVVTTNLGEFGERGSGIREAAVRLAGGRAQILFFGGSSPGTATITVQLEQSVGQETIRIAAVVVERIEPNQGPPAGGITATIFGQGFEPPVKVEFRGLDQSSSFSSQAEVLSVSFDRIVIRVPPIPDDVTFFDDGREVVDVTVTTNVNEPGESSDTLEGGFTYVSSFFVSAIVPSVASPRGGTEVEIQGQGFEAPVRVEFIVNGRTFAAEVLSVSETRVRVRVPAVDIGTATQEQADVRVINRFGLPGQETDVIDNGFIFALDPDDIFFLSHVTPNEGREGSRVTIHGTAFVSPVQVLFDGVSARVISVSETQIVVEVPQFDLLPGEERLLSVEVVLNPNASNERSATLADAFTVLASSSETFFISGVDPAFGEPSGGDTVDITGSGFETPVRVLFGDRPAQVLSVTPTRIRVATPAQNVPAGQNLTVGVSVTINYREANEATDTLANAFTYSYASVNPPVILSVSPASGPNEGGTTVRIRGSNFATPLQVFFGNGTVSSFDGVEATVTSVTTNEIVVVTPAATGFGQDLRNSLVDIMVRHLDSGLATVMTDAYKYGVTVIITSISDSEASPSGGEQVIIFGQGFDSPVAVEMGGVAQQVLQVTGTEIVVRIVAVDIRSCADQSGSTRVVNVESGDGATGPTFTYRVARPLISGVSPNNGPQAGNTQVTISGAGFESPAQVRFGSQTGTVVSVSSTAVVARTPPFNITFDTEECDDTPGDGQAGTRPVPTAVDVTVVNLTTTCQAVASDAFVVNPSSTACINDDAPVEPPTPQCSDTFDNDADGFVDNLDPQCTGPTDDSEST